MTRPATTPDHRPTTPAHRPRTADQNPGATERAATIPRTASRQAVTGLGSDTVLQRLGEGYPAYSEAGFRSRYLDVRQIVLAEKPPTTERS
ncbi:hypothetical protein [Streptomyces virginiae]|uniref:hypothetical protein n=1 Tax=Streptomyces virginiae TaxID=1961 RepID=UPI00345366F8